MGQNVVFHILMDYKYPFQSPRVHCVTDVPSRFLFFLL